MEATWTLSNLGFGTPEEVTIMVNAHSEIIPLMGKQLKDSDQVLVEQTMWFFANIIADNE